MHVVAILTTFTCLATVVVLSRLYTRFRIMRSPGLDDCTIVAALVADLVFFALAVVESRIGTGKSSTELTLDDKELQLKLLWVIIPMYNLSLILTKISIVILYHRLFPQRWFVLSLRILSVVLVLFGAWTLLSGFLFCIPTNAFWDTSRPGNVNHEHCLPKAPVWLFNASMNIATDLAILLLPMPVLTTLNWPWKQKLAGMVIFGVGIFVCATSVVRLFTLIDLLQSTHFLVSDVPTLVWSSIECNVAILCACLPALWPLFLRLSPHRFHFHLPGGRDRRRRRRRSCHNRHHLHHRKHSTHRSTFLSSVRNKTNNTSILSTSTHHKLHPLRTTLSDFSIYQGTPTAAYSASVSATGPGPTGGGGGGASTSKTGDSSNPHHSDSHAPEGMEGGIKVVQELTMETADIADYNLAIMNATTATGASNCSGICGYGHQSHDRSFGSCGGGGGGSGNFTNLDLACEGFGLDLGCNHDDVDEPENYGAELMKMDSETGLSIH